ncbi:MAG: DedA family protein [Bauldia sp.]
MNLEHLAQQAIDFVADNAGWAAPIVFVLAFLESIVFFSLFIPAWVALIGIGTLVAAGSLSFWPVWIGGTIGAALGDWVSYWIGVKVGPAIGNRWPLSRHPTLMPRGEAFIRKWGPYGIFIGRFFGPLRAVVPVIAGIFRMPLLQFQIANFASAAVWCAVLIFFGDVAGRLIESIWG